MGIGLLLLLIFGAIVSVIAAVAGHEGMQFSPDGFQRRKFSYFEVFGIRVSNTTYFNKTGNLELDIVKNKWITTTGKKPKDDQWVMVSMRTPAGYFESDAAILIDYLEMSDGQGSIDLDRWSRANPGYAAVMWPEIQTAAEGNMYLLVPDIVHHMLDVSHQKDNPLPQEWLDDDEKAVPDFQDLTQKEKDAGTARQKTIGKQSLEPFLAELYMEAGKAAQAAEQTKRARFCFEQVLRLDPGQEEAQQQLADLPPPDEKETDEEKASDAEDTSEDESAK